MIQRERGVWTGFDRLETWSLGMLERFAEVATKKVHYTGTKPKKTPIESKKILAELHSGSA